MTIEVQCTSCHTRYRIDEQVLPEGTPTFKCSRCGHVFTLEPRGAKRVEVNAEAPGASERTPPESFEAELRSSRPGSVKRFSADTGAEIEPATSELAIKRPEPPRASQPPIRTAGPPRAVTPPPAASATPRVTPAAPTTPVGTAPKAAVRPSPQAPSREPADDPLSRPFNRPLRADENSDFDSGENLAFDFQHEAGEPDGFEHDEHGDAHDEFAEETGQWQVGNPDAVPEPSYVGSRGSRVQRRTTRQQMPRFTSAGSRTGKGRKDQAPEFDEDPESFPAAYADDQNAPVYNRRVTGSARFFIGLFAMLIVGYGLMTLIIRSSPAIAADLLSHLPMVGDRFELPITPARLVALRDVRSGYIRTRDGHTALLITGSAENVGADPLHTIQIAVNLRDPGHKGVASSAVYCGGDSLSPSMVAKMTPHELDFFQKLAPPKNFVLAPSSTSPFVIVFIDPPKTVSAFDLSIENAVPATGISGGTNQTDSADGSSGV
ncbi:MAG TPA: DUF3426 domain-containing protein [Candidatus Binataceae bacterium]|nr:DUF3426 domain-containing protein [Candidatus Binataceae bacterium]